MQIAMGEVLASSNLMDDENFKESIVFITEHNTNGAMAFIVNKMADRRLNALVEFSNSPSFPLYIGGPVDQEHLFFLHRRADLIDGGTKIIDNVYLGGNFQRAIKYINNKTLTTADIKIFIGYCGWENGELEQEMAEGSWVFSNSNHNIVFND